MRTFKVDDFELCDREQRWFATKETLVPVAATRQVVNVASPFVDGAKVVVQGFQPKRVTLEVIVRGDEPVLAQRTGMVTRAIALAKTLTMVEGREEFVGDVVSVDIGEAAWSVLGKSVRFRAVFTLQPFWRSGGVVTSTHPFTSGVREFSMLEGSTGRIMDAVITISNYTGGFTITDPVSGTVWRGTASGSATLDTANPRWSSTSDYAGAGPLQVNGAVESDGVGRVRLKIDVDNSYSRARIQVKGHRWFA